MMYKDGYFEQELNEKVDLLIIAKPTRSRITYTQMVSKYLFGGLL